MTRADTARRDLRATSDVGRHARLHVAFASREGRTRLASSYAEPPFRVPTGFADGKAGLHAILASSAPGIFGGDRFTQTVEIRSGACVRLTSQSAPQVHPSRDNAVACVEARYEIEVDNSSRGKRARALELDGRRVEGDVLPLPEAGADHEVRVTL